MGQSFFCTSEKNASSCSDCIVASF
uniref:Uncharacterized protein n=1 Tax=Arundo donax TaxID=35708 RepID=A0A0A8ZH89_ARUDO